MSNHVHLALVAGSDEIGALLKRVHSPFANWLNARHERLGPVFADRASVWTIPPEKEARLLAYIHNNPVRAGLVKHAAESTWTSQRAYSGAVSPPPWLDVADGLRRCGVTAHEIDSWVGDIAEDAARPTLRGFGRAAHRFGAVELATPTADPVRVPLVSRPYARVRPPPAAIVDAVAASCGLAASRFCSRAPQPELVRARRVTLRVAARLGLTIAETSAALGITRQSGALLARQPIDDVATALVLVISDRLGN